MLLNIFSGVTITCTRGYFCFCLLCANIISSPKVNDIRICQTFLLHGYSLLARNPLIALPMIAMNLLSGISLGFSPFEWAYLRESRLMEWWVQLTGLRRRYSSLLLLKRFENRLAHRALSDPRIQIIVIKVNDCIGFLFPLSSERGYSFVLRYLFDLFDLCRVTLYHNFVFPRGWDAGLWILYVLIFVRISIFIMWNATCAC